MLQINIAPQSSAQQSPHILQKVLALSDTHQLIHRQRKQERERLTPRDFTPETIASIASTSISPSPSPSPSPTTPTPASAPAPTLGPRALCIPRRCRCAMLNRSTTASTARQPSTAPGPAWTCALEVDSAEPVRVCVGAGGAGSEGTTVDLTTYGQYDLCSLSTSSCLFSVREARGVSGAGPSAPPLDVPAGATAGTETKAQSPILRWHSEQWSSVVSDLGPTLALSGGVPGPYESAGLGVRAGESSRSDVVDGERDICRGGVAGTANELRRGVPGPGAAELARERDGVRVRSEGGVGGRTDHPNSAVRRAVVEGSAAGGAGSGAGVGVGDGDGGVSGSVGVVFVGNENSRSTGTGGIGLTEATTEVSAETWTEV